MFISHKRHDAYPLGQRRGKRKRFPGNGVGKGQPVRVESLSLDKGVIRAVKKISRKRMSNKIHMNTYLMGAPGF